MKLPIHPSQTNMSPVNKATFSDWHLALFGPVEQVPQARMAVSGLTNASVSAVIARTGRMAYVLLTITPNGTATAAGAMLQLPVTPFVNQALSVSRMNAVPEDLGRAGISGSTLSLPNFTSALPVLVSGIILEAD